MTSTLLLVIVVVAVAGVVWMASAGRVRAATDAALRDRDARTAAAEARAEELRRQIVEQRTLLDEAKTSLTHTFRALAADALAGNNQGFLDLAEQKFKALKDDAAGSLDARQRAIETLVQPLRETLAAFQQETKELEHKRVRDASAVGEQLRQLAMTHGALQNETARLVNALRSPHVRGRWGEITLRRIAELAGMTANCDFYEQESVETADGRLRPDMVVRLPAGRDVVVDSKTPLAGYLEALEATGEQERDSALAKYATQVRQHVAKLASKEYWEQFDNAPEFVVLFVPNDSFLIAASEKDPGLVEGAMARKVVIATPATFIGLLRAFAYGWRQEQITENARRISDLGQELADRMATVVDHVGRIGAALGKAVQSYNQSVASLESRVLPTARKFKELGAGGRKEIDEIEQIEHAVRQLGQPDLPVLAPDADTAETEG